MQQAMNFYRSPRTQPNVDNLASFQALSRTNEDSDNPERNETKLETMPSHTLSCALNLPLPL